MLTATLLGTIFAGFLVLGGIVAWLLLNERRIATLEAQNIALRSAVDGIIDKDGEYEKQARDFGSFVRTRLAVIEQKLRDLQ